MNDKTVNTESVSDLDSESTEEVIGLGGVREMTKGLQFGWKIEGGINPFYF